MTLKKRIAKIIKQMEPEDLARFLIGDSLSTHPTLADAERHQIVRDLPPELGIRYNEFIDRYANAHERVGSLMTWSLLVQQARGARDGLLMFAEGVEAMVDAQWSRGSGKERRSDVPVKFGRFVFESGGGPNDPLGFVFSEPAAAYLDTLVAEVRTGAAKTEDDYESLRSELAYLAIPVLQGVADLCVAGVSEIQEPEVMRPYVPPRWRCGVEEPQQG